MSYYSKYLESCVASTLHLLSNQAKIKQLGFSLTMSAHLFRLKRSLDTLGINMNLNFCWYT